MNKNLISNQKLIFRIILILLITSIAIILIGSIYIKKAALDNLAEDDARKTSELIFETMNTRMQEGWGKDDLVKILNRLEYIRKGLKVHSYRSPKVEEILGVHEKDKEIVQNDKSIQKALKGEKQFIIENDGSIRYLFPMKVRAECITCHYNTKEGDINGVLDIRYPPSEIKISLDSMTYYFIIFFILFIILFFYIFYYVITKKIINPIVLFSKEIESVSQNQNLNRVVEIKTNIQEIGTMQNSFNELLRTIKYYYEKALNTLYTDTFTSLPNLNALQRDIKSNLGSSLIVINIDAFRELNNFYGISMGDYILKDLSYLLNLISRETKVYRLYGDEFGILINKNIDKDFCSEILEKIESHNFTYNNTKLYIQVSIAFVNNIDERAIEKATIALRNAKNTKKSIEEYREDINLQEKYNNHIKWSIIIKDAIEKDAIIPYFQPIKDIETGLISKYETLVRLQDGNKIYTPDYFLEISLKSKLYPKITTSVIKKAFEYFSDKKDVTFSINFSLEDIQNRETLKTLFDNIEKYNVGSRLIVEILETEELVDFGLINNFINELKQKQVQVAIDDFGSGYSNFLYLINLNVDYIKIDSSIIENILTSQESYKIVRSIIKYAHDIGIKTIAEKVNSKEIEDTLKELGIDYVQGYYIGKPEKDIL